MSDKFAQWLALMNESTRHSQNANAAIEAVDTTKDIVVNRHLLRIFRRESDLADFADIVAESPVFLEGNHD